LREALIQHGKTNNWNIYIPAIQYTTDNAAMIALTGYYKYLSGKLADQTITPVARFDQL